MNQWLPSSDEHMNREDLHQHTFFGQIFDQTIEGLLVADAKGQIVDLNKACLHMFGYESKSDLQGKSISLLIPDRLHHTHRAHFEQYTQTPSPRPIKKSPEIWGVKQDGKEFPLEISLSPVSIEDQSYTLAYLVDISERYLLVRSIQEGEALLQAIIETAVDGIITIDGKGKVESMNPAAAHLFGYAPDEVVGQNVSMLMPEPYHSAHDGYLENYHRTGVGKIIGVGREVKGQRKDGTIFPFRLSISKVEYHDREIFTGIVHDITAMKEAEEKLRHY
ncbi:MAG: PAS domain S-box protein, partial [Bacteroidota bacterium]